MKHSFSLIVFLIAFFGCNNPEVDSLRQEVSSLKREMRELKQLKYEVATLEKDILGMQRQIAPVSDISNNRARIKEPTLFPATLPAESSYKEDPFMGPKLAPVVLMGWTDFECKPCKTFYQEVLPKLQEEFITPGKIKFVLRDYPLSSHENAVGGATLAHCSGEQGNYWKMHNLLFDNSEELSDGNFGLFLSRADFLDSKKLQQCLSSGRYENEIKEDIADARKLGAKGAPGFLIAIKGPEGNLSGTFIRGAQPYAVFQRYILEALQEASF